MELFECCRESVEARPARLEQHHHLGFVGNLVVPAVERAPTGHERAAGDQAAIEQGSYERDRFVGRCDGGEHNQGVSLRHISI